MAIDLNGLSSRPTSTTTTRAAGSSQESRAKGSQPEQTPPGPQETVRLSGEAQMLQKAEAQVRELPDVDSDRVARIKAAIEDGSYRVDPDRIAGKMLALEDQLFG